VIADLGLLFTFNQEFHKPLVILRPGYVNRTRQTNQNDYVQKMYLSIKFSITRN